MARTKSSDIKVLLNHTCLLGEGPVWDAGKKTICWVDILNGEIHEFILPENRHRRIQVKEMVGAVVLCSNGDFLAALKTGLALVNRERGSIKMLHHPEIHLPGNRFNDGKCDPAGRFWIGSMAISEEPGAGSLYMIDKDLSCSKKIGGVSISNGLAWSPDHKTFYYIDTPSFEVMAFDFDMETGNITNKRIAIKIPKGEGYPDGMTIDAEGKLWIAHWDGWQVTQWDPSTGTKLHSIPLPVSRVTSCTFGGDNLTDLFITSAKNGLTHKELEEQPLAGSIFVIRDCGFQGMATKEFDLRKPENTIA
jgi:sugar lactone lactonase YvrE